MRKLILLFTVIFFSLTSVAQIIMINDNNNAESSFNPQELIENVLISGACAQVDNFNFQVAGTPSDLSSKSYGYFKRPSGSSFPFEEGIVLSTGKAADGGNTITSVRADSNNSLSGDTDLETALAISNTHDTTYITFNFTPYTSTISFNFLMASEEYDGNTECNYWDAFAFLLREVGSTNYSNLAVLPNGTPVSVKNINNSGTCTANPDFFAGYNINDTNYGGRTKVITANANVTPNQIYEMKIVVADQGDSAWDSAIFLEAGSFNLGANLGDPLISADNNAACGDSVLLDSNIVANTYEWFKDDTPIPGATNQTYEANLGNGKYKVKASLGVNCVAEDEIQIEFVTAASINNNITKLYSCDNDFDTIATFDLTDKDDEILDGQSINDFGVKYYSDNSYTSEITDITAFNSSGQTIYASVYNKNSTNCTAQGSFIIDLTSTVAAKPNEIPKLTTCDNDSIGDQYDGFSIFDLEDRRTTILNGYESNKYTLTYFTDNTYTNQIPITEINAYTNTSPLQTIYVQMTSNLDTDCWDRTSFEIEVYKVPEIVSPLEFKQCDDDTDEIAIMDLNTANSELSINYTNEQFYYFTKEIDAEQGNMNESIQNPENYTSGDNTIWVRVENDHCFKVGKININVTASNTAYNNTLTLCDDFAEGVSTNYDGTSEFDLTQVSDDILNLFPNSIRPNLNITFYQTIEDAQLQTNIIEHPNKYRNINTNTLITPERIYIRINNKNNLDCAGMGLNLYLDLIVEKTPYFEIKDQWLCLNKLPTPLEVKVENYDSLYDYEWYDDDNVIQPTDPLFSGIAYLSHEGIYKVVASAPNGCIKEQTFNVNASNTPTIESLTINDNQENNQISLIISGEGKYEIAIDNEPFYDINNHGYVFNNLTEGLHVIHINDKNGCGPILDKEIVIIRFPKYISPNHDGKHDEFYVYGGGDFKILSLTIFNKYGKIITVLSQNEVWDGTYLGHLVLKDDYWFIAKFIDKADKIYERSGNFSLTY